VLAHPGHDEHAEMRTWGGQPLRPNQVPTALIATSSWGVTGASFVASGASPPQPTEGGSRSWAASSMYGAESRRGSASGGFGFPASGLGVNRARFGLPGRPS
jgi:hypothetical protein